MEKLKIKLVKSTISCLKKQIDTVKALGLKKLQSEVIQENTPVIRGMIFRVKHLVKVETIED